VEAYAIRPVGVIRSVIRDPSDAPTQGALTDQEAEIVVDPAYLPALDGLAERLRTGATRVIVLCWMHGADRGRLKVHPRGKENLPMRGVFSTRSPHRPNPVSLHTVTLLALEGNVLRVRGMDAIDGTPVVDIKPHSPELDG
jgi:tRNA-Thr(GGU) m(6)t(6)A37 methyltransferase TsaA